MLSASADLSSFLVLSKIGDAVVEHYRAPLWANGTAPGRWDGFPRVFA